MLNSLINAAAVRCFCAIVFCAAGAAAQNPASVIWGTAIDHLALEEKVAQETWKEEHERPPLITAAMIQEPAHADRMVARPAYEQFDRAAMAARREAEETLKVDTPGELRKALNQAIRYPKQLEVSENVDDEPLDEDPAPASDKFHWKPAIYQSLIAQGFQHGYALIFQEKTRRALKGPFFSDYWESVKGVRGWSDGNRFFTNYIAHPMQGSMTGFIYVQNHDRVKKQIFNESKQYWKDRAKALLWSTAWSTNWEIGPISQSTIGNVGLYGKQGYVDLVITPTVGTAWMITEEALDRYIIRHAEGSLTTRILLRTFLNPTRSVANVLRFKKPWFRDRVH